MLRRTLLARLGFYRRAVAFAPHPDKVDTGGEDSFLLSDHVLGVADGVGENARKGIDAGQYARSLTREGYHYIEEQLMESAKELDVREAMKAAEENSSTVRGSSTLSLATLKGNVLQVGNLGDSGVIVIRNGDIIFRTVEQQHGINHPYQMGTGAQTTAEDADVTKLFVEEGDIVLAATDGILDNLFDDQILALVCAAINGHEPPQDLLSVVPTSVLLGEVVIPRVPISQGCGPILSLGMHPRYANLDQAAARNKAFICDGFEQAVRTIDHVKTKRAVDLICEAARVHAHNNSVLTPFGQNLVNAGYEHEGGKLDDMAVVLGVVSRPIEDTTGVGRGDRVHHMRGADVDDTPPDPYYGFPF